MLWLLPLYHNDRIIMCKLVDLWRNATINPNSTCAFTLQILSYPSVIHFKASWDQTKPRANKLQLNTNVSLSISDAVYPKLRHQKMVPKLKPATRCSLVVQYFLLQNQLLLMDDLQLCTSSTKLQTYFKLFQCRSSWAAPAQIQSSYFAAFQMYHKGTVPACFVVWSALFPTQWRPSDAIMPGQGNLQPFLVFFFYPLSILFSTSGLFLPDFSGPFDMYYFFDLKGLFIHQVLNLSCHNRESHKWLLNCHSKFLHIIYRSIFKYHRIMCSDPRSECHYPSMCAPFKL